MTTPTPEEFLAQTDVDEPDQLDPLESIADSMQRLLAIVEERDKEDSADDQAHDDYAELRREYDEVEGLHDVKQALIEKVLAVCKPSTSKLANSIRAVLEPPVAPATTTEPPPSNGDQPAPDADVEEWREYANRFHDTDEFEGMNRSQIRTMLGLPQPVGEPSTQ